MTPRSPALMYNIPRLKRDICANTGSGEGSPNGQIPPGLYPVSRSAFSGELGWHARKPLELVQGYALVAVHERHDCLPSLPVVEHKAFYDVVFAQPKLPGRVLRAAPFDKTIFQTPHVLTRFFQNTDGWCLSFPVHSSPPGSSYRQEIPYIPLTVDCFSRQLPLPLFSSDACRCFFDTRLERFSTGILPEA